MSRKAAESQKNAARHTKAAKQPDAGNHEKAAHHAHPPAAHLRGTKKHATSARKSHAEEYGKN